MSRLDRIQGAAKVRELLAHDQPDLFAQIGGLDWYARSHRAWIDDRNLPRNAVVLEVGCATGALTAYMAGRGYRVTGIDRSVEMIQRARRDHPGLEFHEGDASAMDYADGRFDAVVAASLINIIDDAESVIAEMRRVCAVGGVVSVLVPSVEFTAAAFEDLRRTLGVEGFSDAVLTQWYEGPPKMAATKVASMFESVGLDLVDTSRYLDGMLIAVSGTVPPR